ncbi:hypothetical protein [Xenorhabdus thuongxuanensis]|uniref:Uncharacterized protein n=1 Tax=Xenorhabdus thuongxuanensis TaxID=1873484 RepID=A0A1Q5U3W0_9GAMM|nr:hypothetical protein [Xenorhabdus thuongxuanensis]OKP07135.1 hypothetical protein Xentx_01739 [Xenorhabdus thuongxuanensis]
MKWQLKFGAVIVVIALMGSAVYSLYSVYAENVRLTGESESLTQQNQRQQFITDNAYHSIRLFNDISRINSENRQRSAVDSEKTQAAIKTVVVSHDCAHRLVPDGVVIRLQQHANRIRSGATDTHSGTSAR